MPWLAEHARSGQLPGIKPGPTFQSGGLSILTAGVVLAVHGPAVHHGRVARRAQHGAARDQGGRLRHGLDHLGGHAQDQPALRATAASSAPCFIGLGRALGETMAVAFIIGSVYTRLPHSLLDPGTTIASLIANTFNEATDPVQLSGAHRAGPRSCS